MITEVKAYSSWRSAPSFPLVGDRAETDLFQIRNIDGLDPVKASISTTEFGPVDGSSFLGSSVGNRNIVLTIHPNPDWNTHTHASLRQILYSYFMPKRKVELVLHSDDLPTVHIFGYVEDVQSNMFSKDPEFIVSIICPDPYFIAMEPIVVTGSTINSRLESPSHITYNGNIDVGVYLKITDSGDTPPTTIAVRLGDSEYEEFIVDGTVDSGLYVELSSQAMNKFIRSVNTDTGVITNLLSNIHSGSIWPLLQPGENVFSVRTDEGSHDWELTYYEKFGGF